VNVSSAVKEQSVDMILFASSMRLLPPELLVGYCIVSAALGATAAQRAA
jgi:hypothetical protein